MTVSTYGLGYADQIITRGDTKIATRTCGASSDTPVIMIMGATFSMDGWPEELITALAGHGLYIIRFDHRDTGQSSTVPFGRAQSVFSMFNHGALSTTDDWAGQYRNVGQPTLVNHG